MPSPAGGQVCSLQLLPSLASAVIIGPKFRATHDHIFLSQILVSPQSGGPEPRIPQERCGPLIPSQAQKNTIPLLFTGRCLAAGVYVTICRI
jgi:hypothetical protein